MPERTISYLGGEFPGLLGGPGQVGAVGGGEVAEQSLGQQPRHPGNFGAQVGVLGGGLEADPAHAGIHGEVEGGDFALLLGLLGQGQGVLVVENRRADLLPDRGGKGGNGGIPQNQNGGGQAGLPKLQRLQDGGDAEKAAPVLQQPGNGHGAVAVGIGLDDGQNVHAGLGTDGGHVVRYGIQINLDIGIV